MGNDLTACRFLPVDLHPVPLTIRPAYTGFMVSGPSLQFWVEVLPLVGWLYFAGCSFKPFTLNVLRLPIISCSFSSQSSLNVSGWTFITLTSFLFILLSAGTLPCLGGGGGHRGGVTVVTFFCCCPACRMRRIRC